MSHYPRKGRGDRRKSRVGQYGGTRCGRTRRGGTSLVELALVVPVLLSILLGIIDFGWLERNTLIIANAAREGVRAAALGQPTSNITSRICTSGAPALQCDAVGNITNGSILMEQAAPVGSPLVYTPWLGDVATGSTQTNSVPPGNYVRITVTYNHRSITGLFSRAVSVPVIMRREG